MKEKIIFSQLPATPEDDENSISLYASGDIGSVRYDTTLGKHFRIGCAEYRIKQDTSLFMHLPGISSLGLSYTLKNDLHYNIEGLPQGVSLRNQYNMAYLPYVKTEYKFRKGEHYTLFNIEFEHDYLTEWNNNSIPIVSDFLSNVVARVPALLSANHLFITTEMMSIIQDLINCEFSGDLKKMFVEVKALDLLWLSLCQVNSSHFPSTSMLRKSEAESIRVAREYLSKQIDKSCSVVELANMVGISEFKLKQGFKELYGTTIFVFFHEERMQKSKTLLLETNMSITKIAKLTGYRSVQNFTIAFKRRFGYPPSDLRRGISS